MIFGIEIWDGNNNNNDKLIIDQMEIIIIIIENELKLFHDNVTCLYPLNENKNFINFIEMLYQN